MILARPLVAAAVLAVAALAGGAWLVAGESPPAEPVESAAVAIALEAPPPQPEPAVEPAAEPAIPAVAEAAPEDDPPRDDPMDLAPWAPSVGVELAGAPAAAEDLPAWRRFAVPAPMAPEGAPAIAILIDDMGVTRAWSERAVDLPGPLTLAFFPHAPDLAAQADAARRAGHELMLHMPMEPDDTAEDPGPEPLLAGLDEDELRRRAVAMLDSFTGYVGVNNHMGSRFTRDAAALGTVLAEVAARGLLFVDSRTAPGSLGERVARELGIPAIRRDVFIDNEADDSEIAAQLAELEALARAQGFAVGIAHPRPRTLDALAAWLPEVVGRGVVLVPVSAVVARSLGLDRLAAEERAVAE